MPTQFIAYGVKAGWLTDDHAGQNRTPKQLFNGTIFSTTLLATVRNCTDHRLALGSTVADPDTPDGIRP
jgi:hypothetical protein